MLNEIDPGIDLEDSFRRMKENEAYVQGLMGTPTHRLYDIISEHDHWYIETSDTEIAIELSGIDDRMTELGFVYAAGMYSLEGPNRLPIALDIYRLRNHYHTRGMFLLPSDPYNGNSHLAIRSGYGYIE